MAMYWPQGWEKDTIEFGRLICNPSGQCFSIHKYPELNVVAFISNLGPNNKQKMLKVGPKFFWP